MSMRPVRPLMLAMIPMLALAAQPAFAWNDTGHKTVALIAWQNLKPEVRTKITALLAKHPQYALLIKTPGTTPEESALLDFMTAATWPDLVRNTGNRENVKYHHATWHYTDIPFITGKLPADKHPEMPPIDWKAGDTPDTLLAALPKCIADIQDPKSTPDQKAVAIAWIEHLVGDVHQPLHAVSWFSEEFPDGDRGGNSVIVNSAAGVMNLHSLWDGLLGQYQSLKLAEEIAGKITQDHPRSEFTNELKDVTFKDWAQESFEAARTTVYMEGKIPHVTMDAQRANRMMPVPPLSKEYQDGARALGRKRIALAGYRLADQFNELFADK